MSLIFNKNILLIIYLSIVLIHASSKRQPKNDDMCEIRNILCVKDVLNKIALATVSIIQTVDGIEKYIVKKYEILSGDTLNTLIQNTPDSIDSPLPTSKYHEQIHNDNNISKEDWIQLLLEGHYAVIFYHNSLQDILNKKNIFTDETNRRLEEIQNNTIKEIICGFRDVLYVYTNKWPSINEVNRIQYASEKHRSERTIVQDAHTVFIIQLLEKWMDRIYSVIGIIDRKFV